MKRITWNAENAAALKSDATRNFISFEECLIAIEDQRILAKTQNPNYPNQLMYILEIGGYAYVVPFVETEDEIFLKTVFPSRKYTAIFLEA